jgi:hypothetical protein
MITQWLDQLGADRVSGCRYAHTNPHKNLVLNWILKMRGEFSLAEANNPRTKERGMIASRTSFHLRFP